VSPRPPDADATDHPPLDRRDVLVCSGALAASALAGCTGRSASSDGSGGSDDPTDDPAGSNDTTADDPSDGSLPDGGPDVDDERLRRLVDGNARFALDLHRRVADGNTFLSPYSVSVALAMSAAGAAGDTEQAMRETLRHTLGDEVHPAFDDLRSALAERETTRDPRARDDEAVDAVTLRVANALWAAEGYPVAEAFRRTLDRHYGAGLRRADFAGDPDGERARINDWVAEQTEETIAELLPADAITANTVAVLTNAIYFLAGWAFEFDPERTVPATFTALDGSTAEVPTMRQELKTRYTAWDGGQAVELPYVGQKVSMVLLVPDRGSFEAFERDLTADRLFDVFEDLGRTRGTVRLPRFEYRTKAALRPVLSEMGMPSAFGADANFSAMVPEGDGPGIDDVYHEAYVSVDEEGTEASAATAVVMNESAAVESFDLTVDRPFLFCVRDRPTDAVLFLGRVTDAGAAQD